MKDHEIAKIIDDVTHVARVYGQTWQIRVRVQKVLHPVLKQLAQPKREPLDDETILGIARTIPNLSGDDSALIQFARELGV